MYNLLHTQRTHIHTNMLSKNCNQIHGIQDNIGRSRVLQGVEPTTQERCVLNYKFHAHFFSAVLNDIDSLLPPHTVVGWASLYQNSLQFPYLTCKYYVSVTIYVAFSILEYLQILTYIWLLLDLISSTSSYYYFGTMVLSNNSLKNRAQ